MGQGAHTSEMGTKCRNANVKPMKTSWKDTALGWMIILRWILKEWDGIMWTVLI
jgi:hypothetical protein